MIYNIEFEEKLYDLTLVKLIELILIRFGMKLDGFYAYQSRTKEAQEDENISCAY